MRWFLVVVLMGILSICLLRPVNSYVVFNMLFLLIYTASYGMLSDGLVSLGPRQGYLGYLIILYIVFLAVSTRSSNQRVRQ